MHGLGWVGFGQLEWAGVLSGTEDCQGVRDSGGSQNNDEKMKASGEKN